MIRIEGNRIGPGEKPFIITEVGINAWNDVPLAKRFIEVAAESGADAVKFQTHIADSEMDEAALRAMGAGDIYDTVARCEWSLEEHKQLQSHARSHDVVFLSTPFSTEAVDVLDRIDVPAIKIGSGELQNRELIERAGKTGKPLLISTGMHTLSEIEEEYSFIESVTDQFAFFYCVSEYPTEPSDFAFGSINALERIADVPVGFSDHSNGVEAAKVAIGSGASIIEKHFTIDRRLPGPDQEVSIEPEDLQDLSEFAELFHETSGEEKVTIQGEETDIKSWAKHSIITDQPIDRGEAFTRDNLTTKRPGIGIPSKEYFSLIGTQATRSLNEGEFVKSDDFSGDE